MRVFSACMKIMKRRKLTMLVYFWVFAALLLSMIFLGDSSMYGDFTAQKPKYTLINRDGFGAVAEGIEQILEETGTFVELEDSREAMMDAGFFGAVDCIFVIPEGYEQCIQEGKDASLEMWQWPSSSSGYYLRSAVEQYLSLVRMYQNQGKMPEEEAVQAALASLKRKTEVTVRRYTEGTEVGENIRLFQRFLPYILLLECISGVGLVFTAFRKTEIRMRNLCSPVKPTVLAMGKLLYALVVGAGMWLLLNLMGGAAVANELRELDIRLILLYLANSLAALAVAISVALLCSVFISSENVLHFATNIVALAMSFLSGVFVPLELMGDGILKVSKLIPIYWYEQNERAISSMTGFRWKDLQPVWEGILIQVGFAAALFCIYLLVNKYQQQAEESFGMVKTEIEQ